jgi:hypothetical protein
MHRRGGGRLLDRNLHRQDRGGPLPPRTRPQSRHLGRIRQLVSCLRLHIRIQRYLAKKNQHLNYFVCTWNCPSLAGNFPRVNTSALTRVNFEPRRTNMTRDFTRRGRNNSQHMRWNKNRFRKQGGERTANLVEYLDQIECVATNGAAICFLRPFP